MLWSRSNERTFEHGKLIFLFLLVCQSIHSPINFLLVDVNKRTTKAGIYWVTGGMGRWYLVGFLPDKYLAQMDALNGQLGQVDKLARRFSIGCLHLRSVVAYLFIILKRRRKVE